MFAWLHSNSCFFFDVEHILFIELESFDSSVNIRISPILVIRRGLIMLFINFMIPAMRNFINTRDVYYPISNASNNVYIRIRDLREGQVFV